MKPLTVAIITALLPAVSAAAPVDPEACIPSPGQRPAVLVEHEGKSYPLTSEQCRDLFLSDPERYSQLFDALAELDPPPAEERRASENASLVPN